MRNYAEKPVYMTLDFGPCGIDGPTDPVEKVEMFSQVKADIPRKCVDCDYLEFDRVSKFRCAKDRHIWGDFYRGLDWGDWRPEVEFVVPGRIVATEKLKQFVYENDQIKYVKEFQRLNPKSSEDEGVGIFELFRKFIIENE